MQFQLSVIVWSMHVASRSVPVYHMFVLSYIHTRFVYFTFSSCFFILFYFSIPFLLPAQHTHHPYMGLRMYFVFANSTNAMFICNRNHSRLMLYFANRLLSAIFSHLIDFYLNSPGRSIDRSIGSMMFIT